MTLQPIEPGPGAWPASPRRFYTLRQTAEAVGLSWERFRKVRADWTRDRDFPAEINEPGEQPRYLAEAVDRWVQRRSRRVHAAPPADARPPAAADNRVAAHGRAKLRALKGAC